MTTQTESMAQTGVTFTAGLELLGIKLPSDTYEVSVNCNANEPVKIAVAVNQFSEVKQWETFNLIDATGEKLQAKEFFDMIKEVVPMSESLTHNFQITATPSEIAEITVKSAFPIGGLDCLTGYSLK